MQDQQIVSFAIYIEFSPDWTECYTICSPELKASTLKFVRGRLAARRRKGNKSAGKVVCEPIYANS